MTFALNSWRETRFTISMRSDTFAPETPHQAARSEPRLCGARDQEDVDPWTLSRTWPVKRRGMKYCGRENCGVVSISDGLRAGFSGNGVTSRWHDEIRPIDEGNVNTTAHSRFRHSGGSRNPFFSLCVRGAC